MKTLRLKAMLFTGMMSLVTITGFAGGAGLKEPSGKYAKENRAIRQDIARIADHRESIRFMKRKVKDDRKKFREDHSAGSRTMVIADRTELSKMKAEYKKDKAYLRADKCDLKRDHKLAISERKSAIRTDKRNIARTERKFRKDRSPANDNLLMVYKNNLTRDRQLLKGEVKDMNDDMVAVNKDIRQSKTESKTGAGVNESCKYCKK